MGIEVFQIPGLEVLGEIGRGVSCIVYSARRNGNLFAVKTLPPRTACAAGRQPARRFLHEASVLACLRHPALFSIYEVGELHGRPYLVMEHLEGQSLARLLQHRRLNEQEVLSLARTLAGALAELHRAGLAHGAIKAEHILLRRPNIIKLADFELTAASTTAAGSEGNRTAESSRPQLPGPPQPSAARSADLAALGALLLACASERVPTGTPQQGRSAAAHGAVAAPRDSGPQPGPTLALAMIIDRLLAEDIDERYQSCEELLLDLNQAERSASRAARSQSIARTANHQRPPALWHEPLLGRDQELVGLLELWHQARSGHGAFILVEGEAGSGKTRLIEEVTTRAREANALVLLGRSSPTGAQPFAALSDAIEGHLSRLARLEQQQRLQAEQHIRVAAEMAGNQLLALSPLLEPFLRDAAEQHSPPLGALDRFYDLAASFILRLGEAYPALLLAIEDVQWVDDASWQVVRRIGSQLPNAHLLVIATARNDSRNADALFSRMRGVEMIGPAHLQLQPLHAQAIAQLAAATLGGHELEQGLLQRLATHTNATPLALREYLAALRDAGLLRLDWGVWKIDSNEAHALGLPTDVRSIAARRIAQLSTRTQEILSVAALLGSPFRSKLLQVICSLNQAALAASLDEALLARLIASAGAGTYRFESHVLEEACRARLSAGSRRALHQRIAETMDAAGDQDAAAIYGLARHYALGGTDRNARRVYETSLAAGLRALSSYADEEAYAFLQRARQTAEQLGIEVDLALEQGLGEVCARTNRVTEAIEYLERAIARTSDPLQRVQLRVRLAVVHMSRSDMAAIWEQVQQGLSELGAPYPRRRLMQVLSIPWHWLLGQLADLRRPAPTAHEREWYRTLTHCYALGAHVGYFAVEPLLLLQMLLRQLGAAPRVGPSRELVNTYASAAIMEAILGRRKAADRYNCKAVAMSASLQNPRLVARGMVLRATALHILGQPAEAEQLTRQCHQRYGVWLDTGNYIYLCSEACMNLLLRGYCREAWHWVELLRHRLHIVGREDDAAAGYHFNAYAAATLTILGKASEGEAYLRRFREEVARAPRDRYRRVELLWCQLLIQLELGELGAPLEQTLSDFRELALSPRITPYHLRQFYLYQAEARLEQYARADEQERPARLQHLQQALRELRQAAKGHRLLSCHQAIIEAAAARLHGRHQQSLSLLARAGQIADELESPAAHFQIARQRAHTLSALGRRPAALRMAEFAHSLAVQHGWLHRARLIWIEFQPAEVERAVTTGPLEELGKAANSQSRKVRRYLDALFQVTLTSGTIIDPTKQARAALDEIVRILGAERAFLFLCRDGSEELTLEASRDAAGWELRDASGYSNTLVEKVRLSRQPLVMTSAAEGAILTAERGVAHELHSIIAAPMLMGSRLVGIIYLDNRLSRGVFTEDDLKILRSIANQLAVSLENSRIAQLEVHIEAERRQRELAETLRSVIHVLNSSLDLEEVLDRVLESLAQVVPYDSSSVMLVTEEEHVQIVAARGLPDNQAARELRVPLQGDELFSEISRTCRPLVIADTSKDRRFKQYADTSYVRSWIGVPLVMRGRMVGVLTVDSAAPGAYSEREAEIAFIFAGHAVIAIENARLFGEVQRLAVTDDLTRLYNRRHFLALADRELHRASRYGRPLSMILLDVDRFKMVNDTYGHRTGDQVLQAVAECCRRNLRDTDILGRYGGEEFAILLPETRLEDAVHIAERLRARVQARPVMTDRGPLKVTISLGAAAAIGQDTSLSTLIDLADAALYDAKAAGRNRVAPPKTPDGASAVTPQPSYWQQESRRTVARRRRAARALQTRKRRSW